MENLLLGGAGIVAIVAIIIAIKFRSQRAPQEITRLDTEKYPKIEIGQKVRFIEDAFGALIDIGTRYNVERGQVFVVESTDQHVACSCPGDLMGQAIHKDGCSPFLVRVVILADFPSGGKFGTPWFELV